MLSPEIAQQQPLVKIYFCFGASVRWETVLQEVHINASFIMQSIDAFRLQKDQLWRGCPCFYSLLVENYFNFRASGANYHLWFLIRITYNYNKYLCSI